MVRNYKKKTSRGDWSEESMKDAVKNVVEGKMGYRLAAKSFSVPQTTLERKVKLARESLDKNDPMTVKFKVPLGPKEQVFTDNEEEELCKYIIDMKAGLLVQHAANGLTAAVQVWTTKVQIPCSLVTIVNSKWSFAACPILPPYWYPILPTGVPHLTLGVGHDGDEGVFLLFDFF